MSGPVAFLDCETTGLDPRLCPIWEVAVIVDEVEHCWQVKVPMLTVRAKGAPAPHHSPYLDEYADEVCHFTERYDRTTAISWGATVDRLAVLLDGRHIVGAVPSFDEERIRRLFDMPPNRRGGPYPWSYHLIDVEAMAVGYFAGFTVGMAIADDAVEAILDAVRYAGAAHARFDPVEVTLPWRSDDLSRLLGVEPPGPDDRHTALGDARWAKRMYEAMQPKATG